MIGMSEILLILVVVMIIFGAGKLPNVMSDLGKGMKSFKDGMRDDNSTIHTDNHVPVKKDDTSPPAMPMT